MWAADPGVHPGYSDGRYRVSVMAGYEYNRTWEHGGALGVKALLPLSRDIDVEAKVLAQTANVYTVAALMRPHFALPVGELFVENEILYKEVARVRMHEMCMAASVGYRMDYVHAQVGYFFRLMAPWHVDHHSESTYSTEVSNVLYHVEVSCRPQSSVWNLSASMGNVDDYNMERHWQPLFGLGARYNVGKHWQVDAKAQVKPVGIFHQQASFYSAYLRVGATYVF